MNRTLEQARGPGACPRRDHGGAVRPARSGCRRARGDACWRGTWSLLLLARIRGLPFPGRKPGTCWSTTSAPTARTGASTPSTPDHLQAHPGDTIVFTLAPNPQAFHTVHVLTVGMTPLEWYERLLRRVHSIRPDPPRRLAKPVLRHRAGQRHAGAPARTRACSTQTTLDHPDWNLVSTPASSSTRRRAAARATPVVHDHAGSRASPRPLLRHQRRGRTDDERPHRRRGARPAGADRRRRGGCRPTPVRGGSGLARRPRSGQQSR